MHKIKRISSEAKLSDSLMIDHPITVIDNNFKVSILADRDIFYSFSDNPDPTPNFYRSKHIFYPESGSRFLEKINLYTTLLNKIKIGHTVVFIVSLNKLSLLRLCECFIGLACKTLGTLPPYVIGKAKLSDGPMVPIWTGGKWEAKPKSLKEVFLEIFHNKFAGIYYSDTGFNQLLELHKAVALLKKKYLVSHLFIFFHWDQITGPEILLKGLPDYVRTINFIADGILDELEQYDVGHCPDMRELYDPDYINPTPVPGQHSAWEDLKKLLYEIYEDLPITSEPVVDDVCANPVLSEQLENCRRMAVEQRYASGFGALLVPSEDAVNGRLKPFCEVYESDPIGNIYSFTLNVGQGRIIVCPEGKEDLISELFGIQPDKNSAAFTHVDDAAKQGNNNPWAKVTTGTPGVVPTSQSDIPSKPSRKNKAQKENLLIEVIITKLKGPKHFSITVNTEARKATPIQVLKFLAMYAASKTLGAHFLFLNNGEILIRKGEKLSDGQIDLNPIFLSSINVNSDIDKIVPVFLPKGAKLNDYIKKTKDGEFPTFQSRKEVKFCTRNNIKPDNATDINLSVELDAAAENEIKAALQHKSASQELIDFIIAVFK